MKQLRFSLMAVALSAGLIGAFAFRAPVQKPRPIDSLVWFQTVSDTDPTPDITGTSYATAAAAATALECQAGNSYYCAAQYDQTTHEATGSVNLKSNP
jgi:hypothetical protein